MAYYQKEYKQARKDFEILLGKFDDVFYGLNIRVAKARLLYEIDDSELDFAKLRPGIYQITGDII